MQYLIEQTKWEDGYFHLVNADVIDTDKNLRERTYYKNGSYFTVTKLDNDVPTIRRTKRRGKIKEG